MQDRCRRRVRLNQMMSCSVLWDTQDVVDEDMTG